jgi:hypothetical protein
MDKWEEMMKKFMAMLEEERNRQLESSKAIFICGSCLSYVVDVQL